MDRPVYIVFQFLNSFKKRLDTNTQAFDAVSDQAASQRAFFHLHLPGPNMPPAAFLQQQEDELKRLSLYIHKQLQHLLLSQGEKEPSTAPEVQQLTPSF